MSVKTKLFLTVLFLLAAIGLFVTLRTTASSAFFITIAAATGILYALNRFLSKRAKDSGDDGYQRALRAEKKEQA